MLRMFSQSDDLMAGDFSPRDLNTDGFQPWGHQMWSTLVAVVVVGMVVVIVAVVAVDTVILQIGLKKGKGKGQKFLFTQI